MAAPGDSMNTPIRVPEAIREQLKLVLLEESDLIEFLGHARREVIAGDARALCCSGMMPVRRPWDPETFEPRQIEVDLRWVEDAWEVVAIRGIEPNLA
jgi:hypothetical protein